MQKPLLFVDTANVYEIQKIANWTGGLLDGVTTNPTLVKQEWKRRGLEITGDYKERVKASIPIWQEICESGVRYVNIEITSTDHATMLEEIYFIRFECGMEKYYGQCVFKFPCTPNGLLALGMAKEKSSAFKGNVTLVFQPSQAVLAAKAGALFVSPFVGRLDDISEDGMAMAEKIISIYRKYSFETMVLVASIRNPIHVLRAFETGADVVSMPPETFWQLYKHPLTDIGLEKFSKDWNG